MTFEIKIHGALPVNADEYRVRVNEIKLDAPATWGEHMHSHKRVVVVG
jgi:hypothetical protein